MRINCRDRDVFTKLLKSSENRLIELILQRTGQHSQARCTTTLKQALRDTVSRINEAMMETVKGSDQLLEPGLGEDLTTGPGAQFGILHARLQHAKGGDLALCLGLMKHYRQAYLDLLREFTGFDQPDEVYLLVNRFYDRTELACCNEWAEVNSGELVKELSRSNLHLVNRKNRYLALFESLLSPLIVCDEAGKVVCYNHAAGRLLLASLPPGDHYCEERHHDLDPPQLDQELAQLMAEDMACLQTVKTYQTPEGEKTYDVKIKRVVAAAQKSNGYSILFNDITERQQRTKQLEEMNRQQQQLIEELQRTTQRRAHSEKMTAIAQLASGLAHEINTPIQYLNHNIRFLQEAFADLLETSMLQQHLLSAVEQQTLTEELTNQVRSRVDDAEMDYLMKEIPIALRQSAEGVNKVSTLVSAIKKFARPGVEGKVDTNINASIMDIIDVSANQWKYHARMVTDLADNLPFIPTLPGELNLALFNIIVNAANAVAEIAQESEANQKGTITVRTHQDGDWIVIHISDTGPGIPDEIKSKIFDPFFTTKDVGEGTGQGLTVAYLTIVEKHGGKIHILSDTGGGTTFEIRLPIPPALNNIEVQSPWRRALAD
jgi:signal transduction histidine kinase